jgi:hypothetical protein
MESSLILIFTYLVENSDNYISSDILEQDKMPFVDIYILYGCKGQGVLRGEDYKRIIAINNMN